MAEVLVLVEHAEGALKKVTAELITAARALGEPAAVVSVRRAPPTPLVDGLKAAGAAKIYVAESDDAENYLITPYVDVLAALAESASPAAVLLAANADGKEIAGRLAARIGSGLLVDVVEVKEGDKGVHSIFGGAFTVEAAGQRRHPGDHRAGRCHRGRAGRRRRRAGHASRCRRPPRTPPRSPRASPRWPATARS